ncbi:hypothetical protein CYMTET_35163 [Cymbomonas tetramitiformis]|uniref:Chorein N-terminal domain-containing protein n=1 Tax=Cymbomonas tetramitiformis TaxID=36881 RepID=A0AAE0F9L8_9CHLO|nr:hypothetical protein CYMTET_35163 [Cymbomonas tetramitiformis]
MERLLTSVVTRCIKRFIKVVDGEDTSNLRVGISGGSVILRNLELRLDEFVERLPVSVDRAFARELHIKIPWTRIASEPIEIRIETVECVLSATSPSDEARDARQAQAVSDDVGDVEADLGGSWLVSILAKTLANVTLTIQDLVCKYATEDAVATLLCESVRVFSCDDLWQPTSLADMGGWLKKAVQVQNFTFCVDENAQQCEAMVFQDPLVQSKLLRARVSLPLFLDEYEDDSDEEDIPSPAAFVNAAAPQGSPLGLPEAGSTAQLLGNFISDGPPLLTALDVELRAVHLVLSDVQVKGLRALLGSLALSQPADTQQTPPPTTRSLSHSASYNALPDSTAQQPTVLPAADLPSFGMALPSQHGPMRSAHSLLAASTVESPPLTKVFLFPRAAPRRGPGEAQGVVGASLGLGHLGPCGG